MLYSIDFQPHRVLNAAEFAKAKSGDWIHSENLPGLKEAGEVAALTQFWDFQVKRANASVERAISISVTPSCSVLGSFVAARANQAVHIGLHQQLKNGFCDGAQEIALIVLLQELNNIYTGLGHRGLRVVRG